MFSIIQKFPKKAAVRLLLFSPFSSPYSSILLPHPLQTAEGEEQRKKHLLVHTKSDFKVAPSLKTEDLM